MPYTPRQKTRRKKNRRGALYAPLALIIICAAIIMGMSVFFRVSKIEVSGNSLYTEEEIIEASGIEKGDNLFFINRFSAVSHIFSHLPYIEEASVTRGLPNRVIIEVSESIATAYVTVDTQCWTIDRNCKLLSTVEPVDAAGLIKVTGVVPINPEIGNVIAPGEADDPKVLYLADILDQIQKRGMTSDITWIDISAVANPSFDYQGRFTVKLGPNENTEYKFGMLISAVSQLTAGDKGTIDLSIDKKVHFSPE
jgi:cell division protein FtsQ